MIERIAVHGISAPFGVAARLSDGIPTVLTPGCFSLAGRITHLLAGDHGAPTVASTYDQMLDLFEVSNFGLGFRAWIPIARGGVIGPIARGSMSGCSVSFQILRSHAEITNDGVSVMSIDRAVVDHIALCSSPCYGDYTGAWLAKAEPHLRGRLADFAARVRAGLAEHETAKQRRFAARKSTNWRTGGR